MSPPLGQKRILAIDPGFRTGCKLVCLDQQGRLLHNETIYPHPPKREVRQAMNKILHLVDAYDIEAIAIGNGTAGRETEDLVRQIPFDKDITAVVVNESGASVYSASDVARKEFPDYDVTVRGAVSIGRRLMDPLAELVKIDPKAIGVGQYQHDVDQNALKGSLNEVVESCVNAVGVEVNTASPHLLAYVSGLGSALAENIVKFRNEQGPFRNRRQLMQVSRFGPKAFEQSAGFLRIRTGDNPLDASAVHPESYGIVEAMALSLQCEVADLITDPKLRERIRIEDFVSETVGLPTLKDILAELEKPGRDPRSRFTQFRFSDSVREMGDLKPGMELPGIVTNITAFGAFVDIGVHQDGLVHVSEMANKYIRDPNEVVQLHQQVLVKVLEVDIQRKRIQLSMKQAGPQPVMRSRQ
ncbi:MAG: helix-hairpin-helix domain-containing protein [Bacteroidales bacterium]|nr:helix-hairpin-helix domain-containing protein [Bacteroidales bacterium]